MAYLERRRLQADLTLTADSGTWQLKLPKSGDLSAIEIMVAITNGATSGIGEDVYDAIDKIEVVANGSFVLYSLTGHEARHWSHVFLRKRPPYIRDEQAAAVQQAYFILPFGLKFKDPKHWLPLTRFNDVELRITYSPTIAATSFATGTTTFTVYGYFWQMGSPGAWEGYCRTTELAFFTSAASGDEIVDLPVGNDWLALGVRVYESAIDPHTNIDVIDLSINQGQAHPIIGEFEDLNRLNSALLGIDNRETGTIFKSDTDTIETRVGSLEEISIEPIFVVTTPGTTDTPQQFVGVVAGSLVTLDCQIIDAATTAADAANTTDYVMMWSATGKHGLGHFCPLPFDLESGDNPFPSGQFGRAQLVLTQGNAGAEVRVSLMELMRQ